MEEKEKVFTLIKEFFEISPLAAVFLALVLFYFFPNNEIKRIKKDIDEIKEDIKKEREKREEDGKKLAKLEGLSTAVQGVMQLSKNMKNSGDNTNG